MPVQKKVPTTSTIVRDGILAGKTANQIIALVKRKRPESKVDIARVRIYANELAKSGGITSEYAEEKFQCGKRGRKPSAKKSAPKKAKAQSVASEKPVAKKAKAAPKKAPVKVKRKALKK